MPALWFSIDPVQQSLLLLVAATAVLYVGNRLLWAAVPAVGLWRGAAVAGPVVLVAAGQTLFLPGAGVALLIGAAVLAATLGLGVSTLDDVGGTAPETEPAVGSPALRTLLPLAATVCLAGFRGELLPTVALAVAVVGGLTLWTAAGDRPPRSARAYPLSAGLPAALVLLGGLVLLWSATARFRHGVGNAPLTPVVVLLTVPPLLLALIGLLAAEPRRHGHAAAQETVVGFCLTCLGVGLPLAVLVGRGWPVLAEGAAAGRVPAFVARVLPDVAATTQPGFVPVAMPISTWRIDSALFLVVALLLMPVGAGRFRLGRVEGFLLIGLYLAYAAVATRTGGLAG